MLHHNFNNTIGTYMYAEQAFKIIMLFNGNLFKNGYISFESSVVVY